MTRLDFQSLPLLFPLYGLKTTLYRREYVVTPNIRRVGLELIILTYTIGEKLRKKAISQEIIYKR
jgi:hypothetical protein